MVLSNILLWISIKSWNDMFVMKVRLLTITTLYAFFPSIIM